MHRLIVYNYPGARRNYRAVIKPGPFFVTARGLRNFIIIITTLEQSRASAEVKKARARGQGRAYEEKKTKERKEEERRFSTMGDNFHKSTDN